VEKYREFLALWKDADPELPVLQQARSEHQQLQQKLINPHRTKND
jgi:hypothetical protein